MRRFVVAFTLLLLAMPVLAGDASRPDYSADALRQILISTGDDPPAIPAPNDRFHAGLGFVGMTAFGIDWKFYYLPMLMPFSGSVRYSDPSSMWPDPFALTQTQFAETPRNWRNNREVSKERKRIENMAKVETK
jgi:hypothetical protein